jgi:hypothetical protein
VDVDISEDGNRIVAATDRGNNNQEIIYIIDPANGNVIHSCILSGTAIIGRTFKFG